MHTEALLVMGLRHVHKNDAELAPADATSTSNDIELIGVENYEPRHFSDAIETKTLVEGHPVSVVEQRVSNLAQGTLSVVSMTGPFQRAHVLGLVPRGVLAGLL